MLVKAVREAEQVRIDMVSKARQEAEHVVSSAREQIVREKNLAILELRAQVADLAIEAAGKIVRSSLTPEAQRTLVQEYHRQHPLPGSVGLQGRDRCRARLPVHRDHARHSRLPAERSVEAAPATLTWPRV